MILATNNEGKLQEIRKILHDYQIFSLKDKNIDIDVREDADTFYGNALLKAKAIYDIASEPVIADDSGLCIEALNNFQGVYTHRWLDGTDHDRNMGLIDKLKGINNRTCFFICNMVYFDRTNIISVEGKLKGTIAFEEKGSNGFAFDSIFMLDNGKTLAELTEEEKNEISARSIACKKLKKELDKYGYKK